MSRYIAARCNRERPARYAARDTTTGAFVSDPATPGEAATAARLLNAQDRRERKKSRTEEQEAERLRKAQESAVRGAEWRAQKIAADIELVRQHGGVQAAADATGRSKQSFYRPGFAEAMEAAFGREQTTVSVLLPANLAAYAQRWVARRGRDDLLASIAERVTDAAEPPPAEGRYRPVPLDSAVWLACGGIEDAERAEGRFRAALRALMRDVPKPDPIARHTSKGPVKWTEDVLRALITKHSGSIVAMARAEGVVGPSISVALARRGLSDEARAARIAAGIATLSDAYRDACEVE